MHVVPSALREFLDAAAKFTRLLAYARRERRLLAGVVSTLLASTLILIARPWPAQFVVDSVLGSQPVPAWLGMAGHPTARGELLLVAAGLMAAAIGLGQLLRLVEDYATERLGQRLVFRLRCDLFVKLQQLSLAFHDRHTTADLVHRVTRDALAIQNIVTYGLLPLMTQLVTLVAITAAMFILNVQLGLVAIGVVPVLAAWSVWFSEKVKGRSRRLAAAEGNLNVAASEPIGAVRLMKAFATEDSEAHRFERSAHASMDAYIGVNTVSTFGSVVTGTVAGLAGVLALFIGARLVLSGRLQLGELIVFAAYLQALHGPATHVASAAITVQRSTGSVERLMQILDETRERDGGQEEAGNGDSASHVANGQLSYHAVTFRYDAGRPALQEVSFSVAPGEMVAVVGPSGAGKTTLMNLLLRFYSPDRGQVLLDGVDIASVDVRWLRRQIAVVLQDSIILSGTIEENVAYGSPEATHAEILAASEAAGLHEFVAELPQGYRTDVGERGLRLSAGQRQRIAIARAFLKDAAILLLDEPTANLDATSERQIFETLRRLAHGRTTLVISHRLGIAQLADRVIVLQGGQIVEQGTPEDLSEAGGLYARLQRSRFPQPSALDHKRARSVLLHDVRVANTTRRS